MKAVLITRPAEQARSFSCEIEALGFETLCAPMLEIVAEDFPPPDLAGFDGLIFTSGNAVRLFAERVEERDIAVFTPGLQTAAAAEAAGYRTIKSANGTAGEIPGLITKPGGRYLYISGAHRAADLPQILTGLGHRCERLTAYTARAADKFPPETVQALKRQEIGLVTFFSARTARTFAGLIERAGLAETPRSLKALCISPAVLECVQALGWAGTYTSRLPGRAGMVEALRSLREGMNYGQGNE